jgi:hypothetical protein
MPKKNLNLVKIPPINNDLSELACLPELEYFSEFTYGNNSNTGQTFYFLIGRRTKEPDDYFKGSSGGVRIKGIDDYYKAYIAYLVAENISECCFYLGRRGCFMPRSGRARAEYDRTIYFYPSDEAKYLNIPNDLIVESMDFYKAKYPDDLKSRFSEFL